MVGLREKTRLEKLGFGCGTLVAALIVCLCGVAPAQASEEPSLTDVTSVLADVNPALLAQTVQNSAVEIDATQSDAPPLISVDAAPAITGAAAMGASFSVDYAIKSDTTVNGVTVLTTDTPEVAAYVQPTANGVRVITAIASASAPSEYSYTFDVPADTVLAPSSAGFYLESGSNVLGAILPPWATDASGRPVPTSYSWANSVLTQHVDLSSPAIDFPVLADPAWGYAFTFATSKTPAANKALLKRCFNCYFPVAGAPKQFPAPGQLLPLKVWLNNFECKFRSEFTASNYFGFQLDATKNHVDGLGSNIVFEFKMVGGARKLIVSTYIVNVIWYTGKLGYEAAAAATWAIFARNVNAG